MEYYDSLYHWGEEMVLPKSDVMVMFSGGADSTMLLYILMDHYKDTGYKVYAITRLLAGKVAVQGEVGERVIRHLIKKTGNTNIVHSINYEGMGEWYMNRDIIPGSWAGSNPFNLPDSFVYNGITANPPLEVADAFCGAADNADHHKERDPLMEHPTLVRYHDHHCWVRPFSNLDKQKIAELYKKHDLMDDIYPLTRSCESNEVEHSESMCGECWWCKERIWGFGKLT